MSLTGPEPLTMLAEKAVPIIEVFGPTIQGEGPLAGSVSHFVRVGLCDYRCRWCDSSHAVLPENVRLYPRERRGDIMARVLALPPAAWVTLSGGNPALYDLELLVDDLHFAGFKVAVETQGSRWQGWLNNVDQLTISPKPPSSGMDTTFEALWQGFLSKVYTKAHPAIKVPIFDQVDFEWAVELHKHLDPAYYPFYLSIVTRMGGLFGDFDGGAIDTIDEVLARYRQVVDWTLAEPTMKDIKVIPQLHVLLWAHERGK